MKFAHIADTHIKNLKYHNEYKTVFNKMYETLLNEKVDYIIHCGDIAHTKTQISPEFVEMAADFFINLAAIAPTYIILGNHDGNLTNLNLIQLLLSYAMQIEWADSVVVGANSIDQVKELTDAANNQLEFDWEQFESIPEPLIDPRNWN